MKTPWEMAIDTNGFCNMTKMIAMYLYGKKPNNYYPEPEGQCHWDLVCSTEDVWPIKFVQMMVLG